MIIAQVDTFCYNFSTILAIVYYNIIKKLPNVPALHAEAKMKTVKCPKCNSVMQEFDVKSKRSAKYEDCIRRCITCEIGASNAQVNPTFIYRDYRNNIPDNLLKNLDKALENTLNETNRENKKIKMGFSTSEDAVSWIFIKYFLSNNKLPVLQKILNLEDEISEILMWGVPQMTSEPEYTKKLKNICSKLGEDKKYYTEPDIIIITKSASVFIEVKVKSGNDKQAANNKNYDKYLLDEFYTDIEAAKNSSYYELIRNWTIGNMFSKQNFRLINLAPQKLFDKEQSSDFEYFKNSLKGNKRFIQLSWESVLQTLKEWGIENRFYNELKKRISC